MDSEPDNLDGRSVEELRQLIRGLQATVAQQRQRIEALEQGGWRHPWPVPVDRILARWSRQDNEPGPRHAPWPL